MAELRADVIAQIEELSTLVAIWSTSPATRQAASSTNPSTCPRPSTAASSGFGGAATTSSSTSTSSRWQVYGDAAGLSRAVLNLLDNAAKWSPPNGRVGVRLTQTDPVHAELVVSDYGPESRRTNASWSSNGSSAPRPRGPCPALASALPSSSRSCSSTAARCG